MSDGLSQQASQPPLAGSGGGSPSGPSASWSEDATVDDLLGVRVGNPEDATVGDDFAVRVGSPEDASVDDQFSAIVAASWAEDASVNDLLRLTVANLDIPRTGTPDADLLGDGWTDQASTGTNHGNESLLAKGKATVGSDERRAHLLVGLTGFADFTAASASLTLTFIASTSSILAADTLLWAAASSASRPFTESTLTWANQPATGTLATGSVSVATGAAQTFTITLPQAALDTALAAGWLLFTFTLASSAAPNTVTILSRDNATAGNRPKVTINAVRGS